MCKGGSAKRWGIVIYPLIFYNPSVFAFGKSTSLYTREALNIYHTLNGNGEKMLKRFIAYYKPHKKIFFLDMLAALAVAMIGIVYPIITRKMLNELIPDRNYRMIVFFGLMLLGLYLIRMLLNYFIQCYGHVMGVRMQAEMRRDMFRHLQKLPFEFYDGHETGKIMTRMTSDLFEVSELAHHGPENLLISSVMIVLSFVYLCGIDPILTLIIFACVPILVPRIYLSHR